MASLIVHVLRREILGDLFEFNVYIDLLFIGISITNLLIIDEIETRRAFIKVVFENRYKGKKWFIPMHELASVFYTIEMLNVFIYKTCKCLYYGVS